MNDLPDKAVLPRVFLSYARDDDEPFVRRLCEDLIKAGFDVWFDRVSMPSRQLTFYQEIRDAIAARDRLVLVVGPKAVASAYVEQEWRSALEMGKCVNPIVRLPLIPPEGYADTESAKDAERKAHELVPEELKLIHAEDFRDDAHYPEHLANLVRQLADPAPPLGKLVAVPGLPPHYRAQPDRLRKLGDALLIDLQKPVVVTGAAARVGVEGMAGIGKSVLAASLARDLEMRRAFPDGIFWVGVGQLPQEDNAQRQRLAELQRHLARELGHEALFNDPQVGKQVLHDLLADGKKAVLLILDDVWQRAAADAFDVAGPRCRLLLTTRDAGLVTALAGTDYQVQLPSEAEALALLASTSGSTVADLPEQARQVVAECGRLPLAMALCGGMLRSGTPWRDLLDALREHELEFLADDYAAEAQHQNIARALELSIHVLAEDKQRRFAELAVFPEAAEIPEAAVLTLWGHTGGLAEGQARQLLLELKQRSIAQLNQPADGSAVLSLHDLMHHLATRMAVRLFGRLTVLHRQLLDAYRKKCPDGWPTGPDDGYFLQNLCQHLATAAGNWDETVELLCDLRFVEARCRAGQVFELIGDYRLAQENLPEAQADLREERAHEGRAQRWTNELIAYAQAWSARRDRLARGEQVPEPEPKLPEPVPSCRMWTEEEIQAECERITQTPTRRDRLEAFAGFVESQCYPLLKFGKVPGFVTQQAFNFAPANPVHEASIRLLSNNKEPVILRRWAADAVFNPKPAGLRTLEGHSEEVSSVSVTPDGRRAFSWSWDTALRVWDLESGACLRTLEETGAVLCASVTPDGRRAVSGGYALRVWDLERGVCLSTLEGHSKQVTSVSVTPDGRRAVSGSKDKTLRVWDLERGVCLSTLEGHSEEVNSVSVTPDGRRAVSGSRDKTLRVWDLESGACLNTLEGEEVVFSASVTPDGRRAVSGGYALRVWDLESGACLHTLEGHTLMVTSVSVTADGRWAVSGDWDKALRVWDLESGACLRTLEGHSREVNSVSVTPDGRRAVSGSWDKTVRVWDLESGACLRALEGHSKQVNSVSVTPDRRRAVSGSEDETLRVWDLGSGACLRTLEGHTRVVTSVSMTADGRRAVSGSKDKALRVWDLESGACLRVLEGHSDDINSVSVTPDGRCAVSGSDDKTVRVWDLEGGACLHRLEGHSGRINSVSVRPDRRRAVSGSVDGTLRVWDLESGACLNTLEGVGTVLGASVTPKGWCVVSEFAAFAIFGRPGIREGQRLSVYHDYFVLDLESRTCLLALKGQADPVKSMSVTPDGRLMVLGRANNMLQVLDLESRVCLGVFLARAPVEAVAFISGELVIGLATGEVLFAEMRNIPFGAAVLTAANPQQARCPVCGQEFAPPPAVVAAIQEQSATCPGDLSRRSPAKPEALAKPDAQSAIGNRQSAILSPCPHCQHPLQFNPFFAAAEDYAEVLRRGLAVSRREKGADHEETQAHLAALAVHLEKIGKTDEARSFARERDELAARIAARKDGTPGTP